MSAAWKIVVLFALYAAMVLIAAWAIVALEGER